MLLAVAASNLFFAATAPLSRSSSDAAPAARRQEPVIDTAILTETNPFAGAPETERAVETVEILPETTLQLKLKGAFLADDGSSSALIETPGGVQNVFREGEEIIRGVRLRRVETYRVVISRNGILEGLPLQNRPEPNEDIVANTGRSSVEAPAVPSSKPQTVAALAGDAVPLPLLQAQGLLGTDIPVAVNGEPFNARRTGNLEALLPALRSSGEVTVTVRRSGELVDVNLRLPPEINL